MKASLDPSISMRSYRFKLFADYFQFYLQDDQADGIQGDSWTKDASERMLATAPGAIGVGTARNMYVPVSIEIRDSPPDDDLDSWDQIIECSIDIPSGKLVVMGCTDYFPAAARILLEPGTYQARIYYAKLDSLRENGLEGDDRYELVLWPGSAVNLTIRKPRMPKRGD